MNVTAYIFEILLLIWFFGCVITYRFGKILLFSCPQCGALIAVGRRDR